MGCGRGSAQSQCRNSVLKAKAGYCTQNIKKQHSIRKTLFKDQKLKVFNVK